MLGYRDDSTAVIRGGVQSDYRGWVTWNAAHEAGRRP